MRIALTLRPFGVSYRSSISNGTVNQYTVLGLPRGEQALIANFGSRHRDDWRMLRVNRDGNDTGWQGKAAHRSAAGVLAKLQEQVDSGYSL
jgi:hypothetical protein